MTEWVNGCALCSPMWTEEIKLPSHACCMETSVLRFPLSSLCLKEWDFNKYLWFLTQTVIWMVDTTAKQKQDLYFLLWRGQVDFDAVCSFSKLIFKPHLDTHAKNPFQLILGHTIWCLHAAQLCFCRVPLNVTFHLLPSTPNESWLVL